MNKFSLLLEGFKYSNEEIEDFFIDYVDKKQFQIEEGFVSEKEKRFFTDVAGVSKTTKRCKKVNISIPNFCDGISSHTVGRSITNIESLEKVISTIKQFYKRSGESPNFLIDAKYDDLEVYFYIIGGLIDNTELDKNVETGELLKGLAYILVKYYKYSRVDLKNSNWLEIRTPKKGGKQLLGNSFYGNDYALFNYLKRLYTYVMNNDPDVPYDSRESTKFLSEWLRKIISLHYKMEFMGGDNQVIIKLKKDA